MKKILKSISVVLLTMIMLLITTACSLTECLPKDNVDTPQTETDTQPTQEPNTKPEQGTNTNGDVSGSFEIHFIDVGQADSILIICDGKTMLVDGGNVADSSLLYSYLDKLNINYLDYVVCTHSDEDHCGGLSGALSKCNAGIVYCSTTERDTKAFNNFKKKVEEQGLSITIPNAGDSFSLGESEVGILSPMKEYDNPNDMSIVMRIVYGNTAFMLTGDASEEVEQDLIDTGYDLSADLLKVGHHCSHTATSNGFLNAVSPTYAVICCGKDNDYGFPHEEPLGRLQKANVKIYRTDLNGTIICKSDGTNLTFNTNPMSNEETYVNVSEDASYIGNVNSNVFHTTDCSSLPKEGNRVYFESREDAVNAGYHPCGSCKP